MDLLPYYLGFAMVCAVLSLGLRRRTVWMWYLGWVVLYLVAGYFGTFFFTALSVADGLAAEGYAFIYLIGGLLFWLPPTVWWATHRHRFGRAPAPPPPPGTAEAVPESPNP